jgi:hypothetical protein
MNCYSTLGTGRAGLSNHGNAVKKRGNTWRLKEGIDPLRCCDLPPRCRESGSFEDSARLAERFVKKWDASQSAYFRAVISAAVRQDSHAVA